MAANTPSGTVGQQAKSVCYAVTPEFVRVLATQLLIQIPVNAPGKAEEMLETFPPRDLDASFGCLFQPGPALAVAATEGVNP